jgi:hypothetical protein
VSAANAASSIFQARTRTRGGLGLGLALGLAALPKATHLTSYSYRVRRASNVTLLGHLGRRCREIGLYNGAGGFNLDFHTIRHHGDQVPLEEHYVVSRSQRTRSVLTFFAQDHASTEMVYANADLTKAKQAREVITFAEYWQRVAGSKLTTYPVLDELAARGITFLTLRQRGPKVLQALTALPRASALFTGPLSDQRQDSVWVSDDPPAGGGNVGGSL